jgi:threonine synthase
MSIRLSPHLSIVRCFACESAHDPRELLTVCHQCGLPLRVDHDRSRVKLSLQDLKSREPTLWRYRELLPFIAGR